MVSRKLAEFDAMIAAGQTTGGENTRVNAGFGSVVVRVPLPGSKMHATIVLPRAYYNQAKERILAAETAAKSEKSPQGGQNA